jgi:hypothetical protein
MTVQPLAHCPDKCFYFRRRSFDFQEDPSIGEVGDKAGYFELLGHLQGCEAETNPLDMAAEVDSFVLGFGWHPAENGWFWVPDNSGHAVRKEFTRLVALGRFREEQQTIAPRRGQAVWNSPCRNSTRARENLGLFHLHFRTPGRTFQKQFSTSSNE